MPIVKIAAAWLEREDWQEWQALDGQLPAYEHWLGKMEKLLDQYNGAQKEIVKITLKPDEHLDWCKKNNIAVGRDSRSRDAAEQLMRRQSH